MAPFDTKVILTGNASDYVIVWHSSELSTENWKCHSRSSELFIFQEGCIFVTLRLAEGS